MSIDRYDIPMFYPGPELSEDGAWVGYNAHVAEVERLTADLADMTTERNAYSAAADHVRADLAAARVERDEQAEILRYRDRDIEKFRKGILAFTEQVATLEAEVERLTRERDEARAQADGLREDPRYGLTETDLRAAACFLGMFRDHGGANERRSAVIDILDPKFRWIADRLAAMPKEDDRE